MTKQEYEDRDLLFCELLFELGSVAEACKQLDLPLRTGRRIAEKNKDKILEMTNTELASLAYKAVSTVRHSLDEDGTIPKAEVRLKAAENILDRIGAAKKSTSELEVKTESPIILMPAKDKVTVPVHKISTEADKE